MSSPEAGGNGQEPDAHIVADISAIVAEGMKLLEQQRQQQEQQPPASEQPQQ